jgi:PAS domain S-box-containing protein
MDAHTLFVGAVAVGILLIGVLTFIRKTRKTSPGFGYWILQYVAVLGAFLALSLRNRAPDFVPVLLGNGLILLGVLLAFQAVRAFFGKSRLFIQSWCTLALFECLMAWFLYVMPDIRARILLFSVLVGCAFLIIAWELSFRAPASLAVPARFTAVVFAAYGAFLFFRGPITVIWIANPTLIALSGLDAALIGVSIVVAILGTFGFVLMDGKRLENQIEMTKESLEEKERYLKTIVDSVQSGAVIIDAETRMVLDANAVASALVGVPVEDLVGSLCSSYFCPEGAGECPVADLAQVVDRLEAEVIDRNGSRIPVIKSVVRVSISGRECLLESFIDISRRKEAEEAVRESERMLRTVFCGSADVIFLKDTNFRYRAANPVLCRHMGMNEAEITGKTDYDIYPKELADAYRDSDQAAVDARQPVVVDQKVCGPMGELIVSVMKTPVLDAKGECAGVIGVARDVTERKGMEEALRLSEEKFSRVFHAVPVVMAIVLAGTRRFIEVNKAFVEQTGYSREEVIGKTADELGLWADPAASALVNRTMETEGKSYGYEAVFRIKSGEQRIGQFWAEGIEFAGEKCILAVAQDVTERKRVEEARFVLRKLESTGILAGGMAHDFNNLLTVMALNIELAAMETGGQAEVTAYLEEARQAAMTASVLRGQLITFADGAPPIRSAVDLAALLRESTAFALQGSHLACDFRLPGDLWEISADEGQIGQVIRAIVTNAREATKGSGGLAIVAKNATLAGASALNLKAGKYVKVDVVDQGCGIVDQILPKIFDPYFSTKERGAQRGMGLGLTVAHAIMQRHGGAIAVETVEGAGTTFHLYFPASSEGRADRSEEARGPARGHGRFLVMDDEAAVRRVAGAMLQRLGHGVELAKNGEEAIERFRRAMEEGRSFDGVILDLTVRGGMGAIETMEALRRIDESAQAWVTAGDSNDPAMLEPGRYGFVGALKKPWSIAQIQETLQRALERNES